MVATNPTAEQLAKEFCRVLNEWLTPEQIREINRRNAVRENPACCASHDFCDPNQAMIDALAVFGIEFDSETSTDLINSAWAIAQIRGFAC